MNPNSEILRKFQGISENPLEYGRLAKERTGKKMVGFFCSYTPEELVHASGAIPFRLFGKTRDIERADSHLQTYCCSLVRGGLEDALRGNLAFLDGAVFPHTCDSIQRLSDIWRLNAGFDIHVDAVMPVKLNTPSARNYMKAVLEGVRGDLENALDVTITNDAIMESIILYNKIRSRLSDLYAYRSQNPGAIGQAVLYHAMKAAMVMDREELAGDLDNLMESLDKQKIETRPGARKRIMLSGGICNHPDIHTIIDEAGGDVVWDDLCTGVRYASGIIDVSGEVSVDPLEAVARRYIERINCPAKHLSTTSRGDHLLSEVQRQRIDGVVFLQLKFCDPHAFDYPYLKGFLDNAGIPSMLLEIEEQPLPREQLRTRFETFVEMI